MSNDLRAELYALLHARKASGFTPELFETPTLDGATENYTGKRIQLRPDITIRLRSVRPLTANPLFDAIFVECKRVQKGSNLERYFTRGVTRFLDGDYAWAVQQALMVGYLESGQELPHHLENRITHNGMDEKMQLVPYAKNQAVRPSGKSHLAYTCHRRIWKHRNGDLPGDIELLHVWLSNHD